MKRTRKSMIAKVLLALMIMVTTVACTAGKEVKPLRVGLLSYLRMNEDELGQWKQNNDPEQWILDGKIEITGDTSDILKRLKESGGRQRMYTYYDSLNSMWLALQAGEIDEIMINQKTGEYLASMNPDVLVAGELVAKDDSPETERLIKASRDSFSFLLLKENDVLRREVDDALRAMKKDGTVDRLINEQIEAVITGEEIKPIELQRTEGADTIRVAVTGDLPPMDYITEDGTAAGFNTAILAEIGNRLGRNIELINIDAGARAIALSSGKADMVFWMRGTEEGISPENIGIVDNVENEEAPKDRLELPPEDMRKELDLYKEKDLPEGTFCTIPYFTDNVTRVYYKK